MKILICLFSVLLTITTMQAQAGLRVARPVVVNDNLAYGTIVGTSNSNNLTEYLGCSIYASGTSFVIGRCLARNANGKQAYCTTTRDNMIEAIGLVSSTSYIVIRWGNDGLCSAITVANDSRYYSE